MAHGLDGGATDFALTRHDQAGNLDHAFGTDGIARPIWEARATRRTTQRCWETTASSPSATADVRGVQKTDFGIVRYLPDGTPTRTSATAGSYYSVRRERAQANPVAVQPDGKIVVAGAAIAANGVDADFAVARYNADGASTTTSAPTRSPPSTWAPKRRRHGVGAPVRRQDRAGRQRG